MADVAPTVNSNKGGGWRFDADQAESLVVGVIHPDAIGRDGISRTPGPDADGRVRLRDAGLGIEDGSRGSFNLTTGQPPAVAYRKATKAHSDDDWERWERADVIDTLAAYGHSTSSNAVVGSGVADDPMLPLGLDSHRYRCCGNGVVAPVAEWIGCRLMDLL